MEEVQLIPRIPPRAPDAHKGTQGRLLIVAGSRWYPGAAILAARGALRMGAGLITAAVPDSVSTALTTACPEVIHAPADGPQVLDPTQTYTAGVVGPGLGLDDRARELMLRMVLHFDRPLVVDADALNLMAREDGAGLRPRADRVFTPHPGELERLTGERPRGDSERLAAAERFERRHGGVLVLKGRHTVVLERGRYFVNRTGNPGMATAGAGDILSGILGSLLAQGFAPFDAARLGVYLHGLAGDLAARARGEASLVASDIIEHLPQAILQHQRSS